MKKKAERTAAGLALMLANRYVLTALVGLIWASFVSEIDLIYLAKSQLELKRLERQVAHYEREIESTRGQLLDLSTNPERLERFARETYFMKRDDEDLFRIVPANQVEKGK